MTKRTEKQLADTRTLDARAKLSTISWGCARYAASTAGWQVVFTSSTRCPRDTVHLVRESRHFIVYLGGQYLTNVIGTRYAPPELLDGALVRLDIEAEPRDAAEELPMSRVVSATQRAGWRWSLRPGGEHVFSREDRQFFVCTHDGFVVGARYAPPELLDGALARFNLNTPNTDR